MGGYVRLLLNYDDVTSAMRVLLAVYEEVELEREREIELEKDEKEIEK